MITTPNDAEIKHIIEKYNAYSKGASPNNKYCATDIAEEKNTINAHVAAVTYQANTKLFD